MSNAVVVGEKKKEKKNKTKKPTTGVCVVVITCRHCVLDTLNQNLKSLCAHSIAASLKSFDWEYSEPKKSCNNLVIMNMLSGDWPNHFLNLHELQTSLDSLGSMQGIGMQRYYSERIFCHRVHFCMCLIYTEANTVYSLWRWGATTTTNMGLNNIEYSSNALRENKKNNLSQTPRCFGHL